MRAGHGYSSSSNSSEYACYVLGKLEVASSWKYHVLLGNIITFLGIDSLVTTKV